MCVYVCVIWSDRNSVYAAWKKLIRKERIIGRREFLVWVFKYFFFFLLIFKTESNSRLFSLKWNSVKQIISLCLSYNIITNTLPQKVIKKTLQFSRLDCKSVFFFIFQDNEEKPIKLAASKVAAASSCKMVTRGHTRVTDLREIIVIEINNFSNILPIFKRYLKFH